jgi:hypothetical protein
MKSIYFDESGSTGQNLSDFAQPVFTIASTDISQATAEHLLSHFDRLSQKEVKYSKIKKTSIGQRLFLDFLNEPILHGGTTKVYAVHKPFMIVTKLIDIIHEWIMHEAGQDFYQHKAALATANVFATTYPVLVGTTRFNRLLMRFVEAVRTKEKPFLQRFFKEVHEMHDYIVKKHGSEFADFLLPIFAEERAQAKHILNATIDELDPIIPSFMVHAHHWSAISNEMVEVVSDDSSALERWKEVCLEFSDPAGGTVSAEYYGQRIEYPLKLQSFRFVDSAAEPCVRVADLIAGGLADSVTPIANRTIQSAYQKAIFSKLSEREILLGAMWPATDVTPEALDAEGEAKANPAQIASQFLKKVRDSKHTKSG